jgi:uncharacterized protein (DUF2384 family)
MKLTKKIVFKQGKDTFGTYRKFKNWLNSDIKVLNCKPIKLTKTKKGLQLLSYELNAIEYGIFY